jgi:hypothetical protein
MSCHKKNESAMKPIVRLLAVLPLLLAAMLVSPAAVAVDSGDIVVVSTKGEVSFTVNGAARTIRAGGVLEPPATLRTGRDGSVELRQGATTVSVGPETLLEFPALEKRGAPIDRVLQPRGNAFYDIGKREGRKLRIETPYLVGVVKGTQFNVAAQDESTTISLFEGLLEVRASDGSDVVDLKAGEIASRKRGDKSISVMKMDAGKAPTTSPRQPAGSGSNSGDSPTPPRTPPSGSGGGTRHVDDDIAAIHVVPGVVDTLNGSGASSGVGVAASVYEGVDAGANASVDAENAIGVNTNAAVDVTPSGVAIDAGTRVDAGVVSVDAGAAVNLGGGEVDVGANASVNAGPVAVDTGAALNVGASGVDLTTSTSVDAGPVSVDAGAALNVGTSGVDLTAGTAVDAGPVSVDTGAGLNVGASGVDLAATTTVDAGPVAADVGSATAVDLGAGSIDTGAVTTVDAGPLTTDVGAGAAIDLGAGTVDTAVTVGASVPGAEVDVGGSVGADVVAGTVAVGLEVAGLDLGLGVDLGLDDADSTPDTGTPETDTDTGTNNTVVDVGGLLDGLLRRPGRR